MLASGCQLKITISSPCVMLKYFSLLSGSDVRVKQFMHWHIPMSANESRIQKRVL